MTYFLIFSLVCGLAALVDVFRADAEDVRLFSKPIWMVLAVVLPVVGAMAWFVAGRPKFDTGKRAARGTQRPTVAMKPRKIKNDRQAAVDRLTSDIRPTMVGARAIPGAMTAGSPVSAGRLAVPRSQPSPMVVGDSYAPMPVEAYARPQNAVSHTAETPTASYAPQQAATAVAERPVSAGFARPETPALAPEDEPADTEAWDAGVGAVDEDLDEHDLDAPRPSAAQPEPEVEVGRRAASDPSPVVVTETGVRINREAASLYATPRRGVVTEEDGEINDDW